MYKLVIVEDEQVIREGLRDSFPWAKHDVEVVGCFKNGKEILDVYENTKPDIVLLDVNMPIMNGIEFLEALDDPLVSVIILSGYDEFEYAQAAIKHRVIDYLLKPVKFSKLEIALKNAIEELEMKRYYLKREKEKILIPIKLLPSSEPIESLSLKKSLEYIHNHYNEKITLKNLTEYVDRSSTHINQRFQEAFNMTSMEYLSRFRIQRSVELISELKYYLYEVAEMVGFDNYKYFTQVFKKYIGKTPQDVEKYFLSSIND